MTQLRFSLRTMLVVMLMMASFLGGWVSFPRDVNFVRSAIVQDDTKEESLAS